ncbi:hypothetical protein [Streptomyces aureocirculatus]|uniref:hypothetical protein n=1 Tax=Streptomyces aureocirculatus TaxID=67275 RepID=UPI00384B673D
MTPYAPTGHRHAAEVTDFLQRKRAGSVGSLSMSAYGVPTVRGLLASLYVFTDRAVDRREHRTTAARTSRPRPSADPAGTQLGRPGSQHRRVRAAAAVAGAVGAAALVLVTDVSHLFQRHTLYVRRAPQGFRGIGRSAQAPVEFLRSGDGRLIGSQAHLEYRADGREILRGFTQCYQ